MDEKPCRVWYAGDTRANIDYHHGQLRPAVGVHSYQVLRANRSHPELADGHGWTYNHAPMLAHWQGRFYLAWLCNPVGEHTPSGQTLLATSADGRTWEQPRVLFAPYLIPDGVYPDDLPYRLAPGSYAVMHQRMVFYVAPKGRLLATGLYGIAPDPRASPLDGRGVGRVVREIYADGTLGPVHFIRLNRQGGWNESNIRHPLYATSDDAGFVEACEALLADRLMTMQWWEEDRATDGFFAVTGYQAPSWYHAADGRAVALWKWSHTAVSADEGHSWSSVEREPTLVMAGAKIWGQRTSDGCYALVYNPSTHGWHRWPLAVVTGDDGYRFDDMLLVAGEVPPQRYAGHWKDFGPQYVRGILEGNGAPPDGALWVTYSMNKEDIWVSRVPVPITGEVDGPLDDWPMSEVALERWNIHSPGWAPVGMGEALDGVPALVLRDEDPYDIGRAERVFPDSARVTVRLRLMAGQIGGEPLHIAIADAQGQPAVRVWFDGAGRLWSVNGSGQRDLGTHAAGRWVDLKISVDVEAQQYTLAVAGTEPSEPMTESRAPLLLDRSVSSVQRVTLQTGAPRRWPTPETPAEGGVDLPGAGERNAPSTYYLAGLRTGDHLPS